MKQVISQHGWGLDSSIWIKYKNQFTNNNWLWQDNERGYFSKQSIKPKWKGDNSEDSIKLAICHSLGIHLIEKEILKEASHILLINSFYNFIPKNDERRVTIKALKRMEKKITTSEVSLMLKEFIHRSFIPNQIDPYYESVFARQLQTINKFMLLDDFKKLYLEKESIPLFSNHAEILVIKSNKDMILKEFSINEFISILSKTKPNKTKIIKLEDQGHILDNINILEIINYWI